MISNIRVIQTISCCVLLLSVYGAGGASVKEEDSTSVRAKRSGNILTTTVGEKTFHIYTDIERNWHGAWDYCRVQDQTLATIMSDREQVELVTFIKRSRRDRTYWIGGDKLDTKDSTKFTWAKTGRQIENTHWCPNNPDNYMGRQHCIQIFYRDDGCWDDNECYKQLPFICES